MPAPICIIAKVMMKEGMPTLVMPMALTIPSTRQPIKASTTAIPPDNGMLATFT